MQTFGQVHSKRAGRREQEVKLDVDVVNEGNVEGVKELCRHDVQLDLGKTFSRASTLAKSERQDEARFAVPGRIAFAVEPPFRNELVGVGEVLFLKCRKPVMAKDDAALGDVVAAK